MYNPQSVIAHALMLDAKFLRAVVSADPSCITIHGDILSTKLTQEELKTIYKEIYNEVF